MSEQHGAATIKAWMEDLIELARSGSEFDVSAGAEPGRDYAYLEFHPSKDQHSLLFFGVDSSQGVARVTAHRFDGAADEVREKVAALTHGH